jgi:hypothetical protein
MFGEVRLAEMIESQAGKPEDTLASVRSAVWQWQGKEEPQDDQTVVMVVRR